MLYPADCNVGCGRRSSYSGYMHEMRNATMHWHHGAAIPAAP